MKGLPVKQFPFLHSVLVACILLPAVLTSAAEPSANEHARPWIGITSTVKEGRVACSAAYVRAVRQAGGIPVIVPPLEEQGLQSEYLNRLDGLVLIGGWDIPPSAYGEAPHETTEVMPEVRWQWEHRLIEKWLSSNKPLLGICLGAQMTNVVTGGTLIQDIPSEVGTKVKHRDEELVWHRVTLLPGTRLREIFGEDELTVTSSHHQAADKIGKGLQVAARSDDGVVEALEISGDVWRVFLQWHPERMDESHFVKVFGGLVEAAAKTE